MKLRGAFPRIHVTLKNRDAIARFQIVPSGQADRDSVETLESMYGSWYIPSRTAHFMGGVPFGETADDGVIDLRCEVHHYPGLYVVDGSIMPANPGINPTLTIAALAEYAMDLIPQKESLGRKKAGESTVKHRMDNRGPS